MRFIIAEDFYEQLLQQEYHYPDCYVRPGEYLHHMYIDGVKYVVVPALKECLEKAKKNQDRAAIQHLELHWVHYQRLLKEAENLGDLEGVTLLGDAPPDDDEAVPQISNAFVPQQANRWEDFGLGQNFLFESILRTIYNFGQLTGAEISEKMYMSFGALNPLLLQMRKLALLDIVGQRGTSGDASLIYEIKPPKGTATVQEALEKTSYIGPLPVPFEDYVEAVLAQSIKKMVVTRRSIRKAFEDLIISEAVFNEIGPAINSGASVFLFGYPGNGKTSIAERINRLMGDEIFIPYSIYVNGQIISLFDMVLHTPAKSDEQQTGNGINTLLRQKNNADKRFIKIKRPTIIVGGELVMNQLDLKFNDSGKVYEAPLQMKANGGIFMIDDFGRQQIRPMDLLNRWIVPLEKRFDYLSLVNGSKIEIPFDQLVIFSTNLNPMQLADEAFLRRIKFKIEIRDPDEVQYRTIWELVCKAKRVEYDDQGIDYLIEKWYRPFKRPFRMCQPRDLLDQMMSLSKYNMERLAFSPDLIDAACETYFIQQEKEEQFTAKETGKVESPNNKISLPTNDQKSNNREAQTGTDNQPENHSPQASLVAPASPLEGNPPLAGHMAGHMAGHISSAETPLEDRIVNPVVMQPIERNENSDNNKVTVADSDNILNKYLNSNSTNPQDLSGNSSPKTKLNE